MADNIKCFPKIQQDTVNLFTFIKRFCKIVNCLNLLTVLAEFHMINFYEIHVEHLSIFSDLNEKLCSCELYALTLYMLLMVYNWSIFLSLRTVSIPTWVIPCEVNQPSPPDSHSFCLRWLVWLL